MRTYKYIPIIAFAFLLSIGQETVAHHKYNPVPKKKSIVIKKSRKPKIRYTKPFEKPRPVEHIHHDAAVVHHGATSYHYHSGRYYFRRGSRYVHVAPPIGIRIAVLPRGHIRLHINRHPYFYFRGVFYTKPYRSRDYIVVAPPEGAIIPALPEYAHRVIHENKVYYEWNGTIFQKIETVDGWAYEVVGHVDE